MSVKESDIAIVTGGGTGIGATIAKCFAGCGCRVLISGRSESPLKEVASAFPDKLEYLCADVTNPKDRIRIIGTAVEKFGKLDILVNNAGFAPMGSFVGTSAADFETAYLTNLVAPAALIREAIPHLEKSGAVVNVWNIGDALIIPAEILEVPAANGPCWSLAA